MTNLGLPYSQQAIKTAFETEFSLVYTFFNDIPDDIFFAAPPDIWSPADNLVHLIKSCSPVIMALNLPKAIIKVRFGKAKHASRTVQEIRSVYVEGALVGGAVAGDAFLPKINEETPAERQRILSKWQDKGADLDSALTKWSEKELDTFVLPHPLLGNMTVREMLFFTLYHNMHHVNDVQRLLNLENNEWFDLQAQHLPGFADGGNVTS
jgi:hypothetical protein